MSAATSLPLNGVRVVDLTTTIAGPSATRLLADFGAEVIKIESAHYPDTSRLGSPFADGIAGPDRSGYFSAYNAGKLSFALNLRQPGALDVLSRLVAVSDVLVESFAPGAMGRLGLDVGTLKAWNPSLIVASHSLQGQTGPRSRQRGYGQLSSAISGWFDLTGESGADPVGPYSAYTDFIAWPFLFSAVVLALERRDKTGDADVIDHSHVESSAYFAAPELLAAQVGSSPRRAGNRESYACPSDAFPCQNDRWCALTVTSDHEWFSLCSILGAPDLAVDARFLTQELRQQHLSQLTTEVGSRTVSLDAEEFASRLVAVGVAASVVFRAEDLFADEQIAWRRSFRRLDHPVLGNHAVVAPAFTISGLVSGPSRGFPLFGEHTEQICRDVLHLTADQIATYAARGVFE